MTNGLVKRAIRDVICTAIARSAMTKHAYLDALIRTGALTAPGGAVTAGAGAPSLYNTALTTAQALKSRKWFNPERLARDGAAASYIARRGGLGSFKTQIIPGAQRRLLTLIRSLAR